VTGNHAIENNPRNELPADTLTEPQPISNRHTPELEIELSHRKQRTGPLSNRHKIALCNFSFSRLSGQLCPASNLEPPATEFSNRQYPELESLVSYRKQRTEGFLIAKFRHMLRSRRTVSFQNLFPASLPPCFFTSVSNRPAPRLESPVSYRKQTIGPGSNRPKNAKMKFFLVLFGKPREALRKIFSSHATLRPRSTVLLTNARQADRIPAPFCFYQNRSHLREGAKQ
jgi:hypothetical protein